MTNVIKPKLRIFFTFTGENKKYLLGYIELGINPFGGNSIKTNNVETHNFTFPKKEKLKSKKLIDRLFSEGDHLTSFPLRLVYMGVDTPMDSRIKTGVAVPKKNFKSAVKRNRIKRLLREAYRHNKQLVFNNSEGNFAFLILYIGREMPSFVEIDKGMQIILQKFLKKIDNAKVD